jgi:hypothetical protein
MMDKQGPTYQIKVLGELDPEWSDWFAGIKIETVRESAGTVMTTLTGAVVDQSALRGIVCMLWDLNLTLISIVQIDRRETQ